MWSYRMHLLDSIFKNAILLHMNIYKMGNTFLAWFFHIYHQYDQYFYYLFVEMDLLLSLKRSQAKLPFILIRPDPFKKMSLIS